MGFWADAWEARPWVDHSTPPMQWTPLTNDDPDWAERLQLEAENRRLKKRLDLLRLKQENGKLRQQIALESTFESATES